MLFILLIDFYFSISIIIILLLFCLSQWAAANLNASNTIYQLLGENQINNRNHESTLPFYFDDKIFVISLAFNDIFIIYQTFSALIFGEHA
jgi:hypothetical protein